MGLLVEFVSDAVAAELPYDPVTVVLRELLDSRSYVTEALAWAYLGDPGLQALPGDVQEFACPWRDVAYRVRVAGIADPTIQCGPGVNAHDIPSSQPPRPRDPVDYLLVDRRTDSSGEGRNGWGGPVS